MKSNQTKKRSKIGIIIGSGAIIAYISLITFGSHGLIQWYDLNEERNSLLLQLKKDSIRHEHLKQEKIRLLQDDAFIEKVAREKYNLQKEDEKVYQIEKKDLKKKETKDKNE